MRRRKECDRRLRRPITRIAVCEDQQKECSGCLVRSTLKELQVAVSYFWGEREFGIDFRRDAARVSHHQLNVFQAESFGAQNGGKRMPCRVRTALLPDAGCADGLVVPALQGPDRDAIEDGPGSAVAGEGTPRTAS